MSNKWILSATEVETFETCRRKWAYSYLDAIKPPPSKAAQFGLSVHEFLQKYLTGTSIDLQTVEGQVASAGLRYLPKQLPQKNVERPIFFIKQGHIFHGYIDFCQQLDQKTWLIGDHKTCSSFSTALPAHELKKNVQANIYAQWAFQELGAETVKLNWIYYRTKSKPEARLVEAEIKSNEATQLFETHIAIADGISEIVKKKVRSHELPKNLNACFKYGRCPHYVACKYGAETTATTQNLPKTTPKGEIMAKSFHLFVDCVPTKSDVPYQKTIELSELLKPVLTKIQTEKELSHYRLAGYGQHVGLIANYLSKHLEESAYDDHTAILSSVKTPEGCDTLQTLSSAAGRVVRGF